jgi:hypothetical protein
MCVYWNLFRDSGVDQIMIIHKHLKAIRCTLLVHNNVCYCGPL